MSKAQFWQKGEALDYRNSTTALIEADTILVVGDRIGVAGGDIPPGELGSIIVGGAVFEMPKAGDAAIGAGKEVFWDGTGITAESGTGTVKAGYAAQDAAADADRILVCINA